MIYFKSFHFINVYLFTLILTDRMTQFSPSSDPWILTCSFFFFFFLLFLPAPRLPFGSPGWLTVPGLSNCCSQGGPVEFPGEGRTRGRAGEVQTLQRSIYFIDKATTALYRAEAERPKARATRGKGLIHIETEVKCPSSSSFWWVSEATTQGKKERVPDLDMLCLNLGQPSGKWKIGSELKCIEKGKFLSCPGVTFFCTRD